MKRLLVTVSAATLLTTGAWAQSSTPSSSSKPTPPAASQNTPPASQQSQTSGSQQNQSSQAGIRTVDPHAAMRVTFYTVQPSDMRATDLIGMEVYNLNNENIGEIQDLVIDNGKNIRAVVVSVGGFLGIGDRNVAIDPRSVVVNTRNNAANRVVVNTTKDELKNAPEFKFTAKTDSDKKANTGSSAGAMNGSASGSANSSTSGSTNSSTAK
jgi:sporulation protein YlmC with PRC-barrel domain